jgi:hypothetical protein
MVGVWCAHEKGLINGEAGKQGPIEKEFGVDIELIETDYDTCITMYASGTTDAVCITNMDVLNPALTRLRRRHAHQHQLRCRRPDRHRHQLVGGN